MISDLTKLLGGTNKYSWNSRHSFSACNLLYAINQTSIAAENNNINTLSIIIIKVNIYIPNSVQTSDKSQWPLPLSRYPPNIMLDIQTSGMIKASNTSSLNP